MAYTGKAPFSIQSGGTARNSLTSHAVIVGAGTNAVSEVGPTATSGQIFQSAGSSADPSFSTATYPSVATGTGTILRADGTNWSATTSTYPNTNAVSTLLYASSANVMSALATGNNGVLITSASGVPSWLADGTTGQVLTATTGSPPTWVSPATSGTVTTVSVVTANGFAGTVANATTTPAITLTTSQTGLLSGNGTAITGTAITQYNVITGGASNAPNSVAPSATSGYPLISQGSSAQPIFAQLSASNVLGSTSGSAPAAGVIGEQIRSFVGSGSPVNLSNGVTANITNIVLTAGCWDISCMVELNTGTVATSMQGGIGTVSATLPANGTIGDQSFYQNVLPSSGTVYVSIPAFRVNISGNTTYYLVISHGFTAGTPQAYGRISGTRVG